MKTLLLSVLSAAFFTFNSAPPAQNWVIAERYQIQFSGSGAEGNFYGLSGTIQFDPENLEGSSFDVTIDPSTIETGSATKDKHARGESWFDVATFPEIRFVSSEITRSGNSYVAKGTLEMHGVKKAFSIPFTFKLLEEGGVFESYFVVDRTDFHIVGPLFGFLVDEEFELNVRVPVKKG